MNAKKRIVRHTDVNVYQNGDFLAHNYSMVSSVCQFSFMLRSDRSGGFSYVILNIACAGERKRVSTGIKVQKSFWNNKRQLVNDCDNSDMINFELSKLKIKMQQIVMRYSLNNLSFNINDIVDELQNPKSLDDFIVYFENKLNERRNKALIVDDTFDAQHVVLNKLKAFKKSIPFSMINQRFIADFDQWNLGQIKKHAAKRGMIVKKNGHNTRHSNLKIIKTYLNCAKQDKIVFDMPEIKVKFLISDRESLDLNNLHQLIAFYENNKYGGTEHFALMVFLFMCSTGMRVSDWKHLNDSNIVNGFFKFTMKKNSSKFPKDVEVPCTDFSLKLFKDLKKHNNIKISEQKINDKLKVIALDAGIDFNVSMHIARNTFATLFLENGGEISILSNILGHTNIRTTMIYVKNTDLEKKKQMEKMNNIFKINPEQFF